MRRIHPERFQIAKRGTSREINSRIALNLVRANQPISRADLARVMGVSRSAVTLIVNDLLARKLVFEGATGEAVRGRKPTFLYINARRRSVVAADIRASETFLMVADLLGKPISAVVSFPTTRDPKALVAVLGARIKRLLKEHPEAGICEGVGVVVPGMVEHATMRVLHAPTLGWRNVDLAEPLSIATGLRVQVENSGRACALAQLWAHRAGSAPAPGDLVFISVSDGIGVGVMMNGDVLRGHHNIAGEFGHTPLSLDGPPCSCGSNGCWEAYISNRATLARYFGRPAHLNIRDAQQRTFTIDDLIARLGAATPRRSPRSRRPPATSGWVSPRSSTCWTRPACASAARSPRRGTSSRVPSARRSPSARSRPTPPDGNPARSRDRASAVAGRGRAGERAGLCRAGRRLTSLPEDE